ncbi:hypothetical protein [Streptomyces sp. NPDC051665]|uniref:hypothetical protein n=1 Tax=Streptomyces sp. NPDC051665 TaxID=3154647 RepID=UPI003436F0A4
MRKIQYRPFPSADVRHPGTWSGPLGLYGCELEEDLHEDTDMYLSEYLLTGDAAKSWEIITPCA